MGTTEQWTSAAPLSPEGCCSSRRDTGFRNRRVGARPAEKELGKLDILVCNARPELAAFYRAPMNCGVEHPRSALDSQAQAFLLSAQMGARIMPDCGRMIAISHTLGSRTGRWQPWIAMARPKRR